MTPNKYGDCKAASAMAKQDREKDLLVILSDHLTEHPFEDKVLQLEMLLALRGLNRRSR